jgi:hypothetical protein
MRDEPGRMKTKGSQAKLNGMDSVSAASIAYAALQVRCSFEVNLISSVWSAPLVSLFW